MSYQGLDHCAIFSWDWIAGEVAGGKAWVKIWVATMTTVVGVDGDVQEENTKMGGSAPPPPKNLGQVGFTHLCERDDIEPSGNFRKIPQNFQMTITH
jgi:hypothetical protein